MRIGTTGLEPLPKFRAMTKHNTKDLKQVKGGYALAGSTFESLGSFLFMNITKPKPIPTDICNRCLEVLEAQLIEIAVKEKNCTHKEHLPVYRYEAHKLGLQHRYYVECARLYEKGQRNG